MRVAFLSHNARRHDAIGNQIAEKVRFFQERGAEVRVFLEDARHLHTDLRTVCIETTVNEDYLYQADLVFAVYSQYHELLQWAPRLVGAGPRVIFDYYGVTPPALALAQQRESLERSVRHLGLAWCADHVLTTSRMAAAELSAPTGFPREHTTVLPLPVDIERFHAGSRERWLHERLGIDGRILLYVGRLAKNKRVPTLIEVLARLPAAHAVIVGDIGDIYADEAERCCELARELGVAERVHWLGQLDDDDLAHAYRSADVFVMPSLHEGFCVPIVEAMASGVPVVASRSAALPETLGDAGLSFVPDDVADLEHVLRRVTGVTAPAPTVAQPRRVAVVSFRFGPEIVGGAETSLRTMATALHAAGHHVEVFTTCTTSESHWRNDLSAGTVTLDGVAVHRFPIDAHDANTHGEAFRAILDGDGAVSAEIERRYLAHSIHSRALIKELRRRQGAFDAIIVGPYLFGLTVDILAEFPRMTLLAPCFHDEPLARLSLWPNLCREAGGILYHSVEERDFARAQLGVNHPNAHALGAVVTLGSLVRGDSANPDSETPYVVYCGRYSEQKNVPVLLDWARRYHAHRPGLEFVFMGQGHVKLPREPWLRDLGRVDEATKRAVMGNAGALVQLSTHESLSLVVLEAWAEATPAIVHEDCAVLNGQIARSGGGVAVVDYETFAAALDDLRANGVAWRERGELGQTYVANRYASGAEYAGTIVQAIDRMRTPIATQMRERGLERAAGFGRARWQQGFAEFVDRVLTQPQRLLREHVAIEPLHETYGAAVGTRTLLATVRLHNLGTHAAVPDGPGRTVIRWAIAEDEPQEIRLPALLMPGHTHVAALPITMPDCAGTHRLRLWTERNGAVRSEVVEIDLVVGGSNTVRSSSCASTFLDTVAQTLPKTHHLQQLPTGYVDVTEGRLAPIKRLVKEKLLHNFKHAYVDVLARQQSEVNGQVVLMIQQLADCCATLDHAVRGIHERLDGLESKVEQLLAAENDAHRSPHAPREESSSRGA